MVDVGVTTRICAREIDWDKLLDPNELIEVAYDAYQLMLVLWPKTLDKGECCLLCHVEPDSPEIVDRNVKALFNKLPTEKGGRALIQVIKLVLEKLTDEAAWF